MEIERRALAEIGNTFTGAPQFALNQVRSVENVQILNEGRAQWGPDSLQEQPLELIEFKGLNRILHDSCH
jgi:hypothetical protein